MREKPRYLLKSNRSPFFGIDTIEAEFHFLGKNPFHILLNINLRHFPVAECVSSNSLLQNRAL